MTQQREESYVLRELLRAASLVEPAKDRSNRGRVQFLPACASGPTEIAPVDARVDLVSGRRRVLRERENRNVVTTFNPRVREIYADSFSPAATEAADNESDAHDQSFG